MSGVYILIAFTAGWLLAQILKVIGFLFGGRQERTWRNFFACFFRSGGMPSGHAASFSAVCTYLGWSIGWDSPLFALAVCMTLIIVYDAINVRFAVGQQGRVLADLAKKQDYEGKPVRLVEGHTIPQAIMGVIIGIIIGCLIIMGQDYGILPETLTFF